MNASAIERQFRATAAVVPARRSATRSFSTHPPCALRRSLRALATACALSAALLLALPARALIYTAENSTSGAVNFSAAAGGSAGCATPLARTFTITQTFTVSQVAVGLNLSHANRGDVRVTLVSPGGTFLQLVAGGGGDTNDNYDILMSSNTEGALNDADADPVAAPFYNRIVPVATISSTFSGLAANGTWTLNVCDITNNGTNGTFNRAYLMLASSTAATTSCTGTVTFDWGANGSAVAFTNTTLGDITMSQGATSDFGGTGAPAGGTLGNGIVTRTTTNGAHTGYYSLSMDASALGGTQDGESVGLQSTIDFSQPVRDLRFTFLDVDITNNSWEDQVEIVGVGPSGERAPYTMTPVAGASAQLAGDLAEGDAVVATTATGGNLDVVFSGAVSSLTINYTQGDNPATENNFMVVGISDFSFCGYDYGDAPNSYGTLLAGGARHAIGDQTLYLGTNPPDGEADGQAGAGATTDDTTQVGGVDDEDGVASFPAYSSPSTSYTVSVTANNRSTTTAATLVGYIDWNRDGDFADADEISASVNVPANTVNGAFDVTWSSVPTNAGGTTATYARFRISYTASEVTSPTGLATSGEVEDYEIPVGTLPVTLASFEARRTTRGIEIEWTTETETETIGYLLSARTGKGWRRIGPTVVPAHALDRLAPQTYRVVVADEGYDALLLEDANRRGETTRHGPFALDRPYGRKAEAEPIDWSRVRAEIAAAAEDERAGKAVDVGRSAGIAELRVARDGLYRVTHEDLLAAGIDYSGARVTLLALRPARRGLETPIYVQGSTANPEAFGPGAFVEFRGEAVAGSLHTEERVYRLSLRGGRPARVRMDDGTPHGDPIGAVASDLAIDRNLVYSFASPNGDPWYEAGILSFGAPAAHTFALDVDALEPSGAARLRIDLWGVTDWPSAPDHHLQIALNGTRLLDDRFDGLTARSIELAVPPGLLFEGTNQLEIALPGDTGNAFDLVHVDRYTLTYARRTVARGDRLNLPATAGRFEITGLSAGDVAVWADGGRARLANVAVTGDGAGFRAEFSAPLGGAIDVATAAAYGKPNVRAARTVAPDLGSGRADYLIVTHPSLAGELGPLVAAREASGLRVKVVDVRDLYDTYTGGEVDPQAIKGYVKYAVERLGVRYVLLVGADTYDYLDHLGIGSVSLIPTPYVATDELIRFTPSDAIYGDLNGDGIQDVALGRLPARTAEELRSLIGKTLAFAATPAGAVFAADGSADRSFAAVSDRLLDKVPANWSKARAYVDDAGLPTARQSLLSAFDRGSSLVHFVGHSGPTAWTFSGLFSAADATALGNLGRPSLVVQWGCWNTYHVAPEVDTMAHRLLLSGNQGAAAVVGSSTLSKTLSDQLIGSAFFERLMVRGTRVGDALVAAKRQLRGERGDFRDALYGWTLLGDPALVLRP